MSARPAVSANAAVEKAFLISLARMPERGKVSLARMAQAGIEGEIFQAVDGWTETPEQLFRWGVTELWPTTAACAASHILLWRKIIQAGYAWTLVCEDDVIFHEHFERIFPLYWEQVPKDAWLVYVGHGASSGTEKGGMVNNRVGVCTHAYIVSQAGAQRLLQKVVPCECPIDTKISQVFQARASGIYSFNGEWHPSRLKQELGCQCHGGGLIFQDRAQFPSSIGSYVP